MLKASDGEQALATAIAEQPDIIVCDLVMPHMDGQQLLTQLKTDARTSHAHTIILTARSAEDDMVSALDRGADAFLTKPISPFFDTAKTALFLYLKGSSIPMIGFKIESTKLSSKWPSLMRSERTFAAFHSSCFS